MLLSTAFFVLATAFNMQAQPVYNFTTQPVDQIVYVGASVHFNCSYSAPVFNVKWVVNERSPKDFNRISNSCQIPTYNASDIIISVSALDCNGTEVKCVAVNLTENTMQYDVGESDTAILSVQELPRIEKLDLEPSNGTIQIIWDPIPVAVNVNYQVTVFNATSGELVRRHTTTNVHYLFIPDRASNPCDYVTYNVSVTPTFHDHPGPAIDKISSLFEDLSAMNSTSITDVIAFESDGNYYYEFTFPQPVSICSVTIKAISALNHTNYNITKHVNSRFNRTFLVTLTEPNELPFDEHYSATVLLQNNATHSVNVTVTMPINFSTYAIRDAVRNGNHLMLQFVRNAAAQGALLVFGNSSGYDYIPIGKEPNNDSILLNISDIYNQLTCTTNCTLLIYTLERDGLPKDPEVRPAVMQHSNTYNDYESEINQSESENTMALETMDNISVPISKAKGSISFTCEVQEKSDFLGCLALLHGRTNYSTLMVRRMNRNSTIVFTLVEGAEYYYAIFPWKSSGIIGLQPIEKETFTHHYPDAPETNQIGLIVGIMAAVIIVLGVIGMSISIGVRVFKSRQKGFNPQTLNGKLSPGPDEEDHALKEKKEL